MLQWTRVCKYSFEIPSSILLDIYQEVELLQCCFWIPLIFISKEKMLSYCYFGDGVISVHSWVIVVALCDAGEQRAQSRRQREASS